MRGSLGPCRQMRPVRKSTNYKTSSSTHPLHNLLIIFTPFLDHIYKDNLSKYLYWIFQKTKYKFLYVYPFELPRNVFKELFRGVLESKLFCQMEKAHLLCPAHPLSQYHHHHPTAHNVILEKNLYGVTRFHELCKCCLNCANESAAVKLIFDLVIHNATFLRQINSWGV